MYDYKSTMDKLLRQEVAENRAKGDSALILRHGEEIYYGAFGMADAERGIPMKRDTIIHLYSMSKPITSAATMILAERGEIDLHDPVSLYLPCFRDQAVWADVEEVPAEREVTIYDLLNMTSGITYPDETTEPGRRMLSVVEELVGRRNKGERVDTQEYMRRIAEVPLLFQPGTHWKYGFSADVLGGVVEAVSGMTYGEFLKKELFEPLQMKDTGFFVPKEKEDRFAVSYEVTGDGGFTPHQGSHLGEYYREDVAFESGGAGMVSTLDDYAHFATMLLNKGKYEGKRILGRKTVEFMARNHLTEAQKEDYNWDSLRGYGYGCLMRVMEDVGKAGSNGSPGEFGWDGWTGNYVAIDFQEDLVFLYFMQRCDSGTMPIVRKLRMATYGALDD